MKSFIKKIIPRALLRTALSVYHYALAFAGAVWYRFPGNSLIVIGVTGTKGKSSTVAYLSAIFRAGGYRIATASTIEYRIGDTLTRNTSRMTTPGRFFLQNFLHQAQAAGCSVVILELSSEGASQYRHKFLGLQALIYTNIAPEHIESHGTFEKYLQAKLKLAQEVGLSKKAFTALVCNSDDAHAQHFLAFSAQHKIGFSLSHTTPFAATENGGFFTFKERCIEVHLPGEFSLINALGAAEMAYLFRVPVHCIVEGIATVTRIPGRAEKIETNADFTCFVDYAHTPDSLEALYAAFPERSKICVLGATGGGRDMWKRPAMGEVAGRMCTTVILTNEDPYDELPEKIIETLSEGVKKYKEPLVIIDRCAAIAHAVSLARKSRAPTTILITGKGTDPTIQGPHGTSIPWSDAEVTREELTKEV
jgi:UDP-N-acetylmuramoyl-L-alanyl-D-glutamate--2,6-diaminopimelate ligase